MWSGSCASCLSVRRLWRINDLVWNGFTKVTEIRLSLIQKHQLGDVRTVA
jgi:hypothetical protein